MNQRSTSSAAKDCSFQGRSLEQEDEITAGDFIYVPPNSNHQPVNTSETENLVLIVARNTPVELVVELPGLGRKDCL